MKRVVSLPGVAAILLLVAIAATTYFTSMRFAAELTAQDARFRFERWEAGKVKPQAEEVRAAVNALRAALAYEPGNPNLHSDVGRLEYWRVRAGIAGSMRSLGLGVRQRWKAFIRLPGCARPPAIPGPISRLPATCSAMSDSSSPLRWIRPCAGRPGSRSCN
jgi:hypothetical protein